MITINSNGSKWNGEKPDGIDALLALLATEPLDPVFEKYGNFYDQFPEMADGTKSEVPNYFFGNFFNVSHVFGIEIDEEDQDTADTLLAAIRENQASPAYLAAQEKIAQNIAVLKAAQKRNAN